MHNAGWVQSPGVAVLREPARFAALEGYVRALVGRFRDDPRIVLWDLWNEPGQSQYEGLWRAGSGAEKAAVVAQLLDLTFAWARAEAASQPMASGVWAGRWDAGSLTPMQRLQLERSDV